MKAIASQLESILNSEKVVRWENLEVKRQQKILAAIVPDDTPDFIVYPSTQAELAEVITCAHRNSWRILPCGGGSKLGWGNLVENINIAVSTEHINRAIEHAVGDLTVTVEAGMKFCDLQKMLASQKQFLALDPAYQEDATIGGIVSTADTGSFRQRYGGVRDMLLGLSFVRADGEFAKAGGRVVKNVAGYDLMKLFAGCFGTLGIIAQVTFRVYPLPESSGTVVLTGEEAAVRQVTKTLLASTLTPTAIDLLSTELVNCLGIGRGMGLIVRFQSVSESLKEQSTKILEIGQQLGLQGVLYSDTDEAELWRVLQKQMQISPTESAVTCKIGVLPNAAVTILAQSGMGLIHAGSGLGILRFDGLDVKPDIQKMRSLCQSQSGFLTISEAPVAIKQQLDVWGYNGNAIDLMRKIKKQFDPKNLLSPNRFVGGI